VLATGPGNPAAVRVLTSGLVCFGSLPGQKPDTRCHGGFVNRTIHIRADFCLGCTWTTGPFHGSSAFPPNVAPIKYLSSDGIITRSVRRLCSFSCSFTSRCQICDRTNIRGIAVKLRNILRENGGFSITTQRIFVRSQI
jgi:hypothetical protein